MGGPQGKNKKAGLTFPVGRVGRFMKMGRYSHRVGKNAPIFLGAVLEYLVAEILEVAGHNAKSMKKNRIRPRNVMLAINDDEELQKLLGSVTISGAGVAPGIHNFLEPKMDKMSKKKAKKAGKKAAIEAEPVAVEQEEAPVAADDDIMEM